MHGLNPSTASAKRQAFMKRRCLIPVDGFYEWKKVPGGKIPYSIGMKDNSPFVFAGLWKDRKTPRTANGCTPPIVSVSDQPFAGDFRFAYHSWEFFSLLSKKSLLS